MGGVSIVAAFAAGLISFLSPCVLPLVPGYICMVSGASVDELKGEDNTKVLRKVLLHSLLFIAGFSIVFISLGASATWLGQVLLSRMSLLYKVAGVIIIIFGLHLTGLLRIGFLYRDNWSSAPQSKNKLQHTARSRFYDTTKLVSVNFASLRHLGISASTMVGASAAGTFSE